jgi:tetratricopeptide (TPR) repeat protein
MGEADTLAILGGIDIQRGRFDAAEEHYERSLALHRQVGSRVGEAFALGNLGFLAERSGNRERARELFVATEKMYQDMGVGGLAAELIHKAVQRVQAAGPNP